MFKWLNKFKTKKDFDSPKKIYQLENRIKILNNQLANFKNKEFKEKYQKLNINNYKEFENDLIELISNDFQVLLNENLQKKLDEHQTNLESKSKEIYKNILFDAVLNYNHQDFYKEQSPLGYSLNYYIDIKKYSKYDDDKVGGNVFGKGGLNKSFYKECIGVEVESFNNNKNILKISSNSYLNLQIGKIFIEQLLANQWIRSYGNKGSFESRLQKIKDDFNQNLINDGSKILKDFLEYDNFDPGFALEVGKMKFRFSYGQNLLEHSYECAHYASEISKSLGLNPLMAKRAAFLHDIGKTSSQYSDHVESGVIIAQKYKLDEYIIHAIKNHHKECKKNQNIIDNPYTMLVKRVDIISASRPGARINNSNDRHQSIKKKILELLKKKKWIKCVSIDNSLSNIYIEVNSNNSYIAENINLYKKEILETLKKDNLENFQKVFCIKINFFASEEFSYKNF